MQILYAIVVLFCCLVVRSAAQELKPVTDKEKIAALKAQNEVLRASDAIKATAEFKRLMAAEDELNTLGKKIFSDRGIKQDEVALCFGPAEGVCKEVAAGEIELKRIPKPVKK